MIHLDTSTLVEICDGDGEITSAAERLVGRGERLLLSTLVMYEWLRGPRTNAARHLHARLFPSDRVVPFDASAAARAAVIYQSLGRRARTREIDIAIAACAIEWNAPLWTLNREDFQDIPGLALIQPRR